MRRSLDEVPRIISLKQGVSDSKWKSLTQIFVIDGRSVSPGRYLGYLAVLSQIFHDPCPGPYTRDSTSSGYSSLCVLRCNGRRTRGPPGQGRWVPTSCLRQTNLYTEVDPTPPRINVTGPLNRSKRPRVYSTINLISESARCFSGVLYQLIYSLKLRISFRVSTHRSDHPSSRGTPSIPWAQGREDN